MSLLLIWFLLDLSWHSGSLHPTKTVSSRQPSPLSEPYTEYTLACITPLSLYHLNGFGRWCCYGYMLPFFPSDVGSFRNGAQIASPDPELQKDMVLWYESNPDRGAEAFSDVASTGRQVLIFMQHTEYHTYKTHYSSTQGKPCSNQLEDNNVCLR